LDSIDIGDTICDPAALEALPRVTVDPPTVRVRFSVNNSPLAGREGRFVTSRQIGERLRREALGNVSIRIEPTESPEVFEVAGRGEMQIGVLIESMRREGYEFSVSRPEIITADVDGVRSEPVEDVVAEVPEGSAGAVLEKLSQRRARLVSMEQRSGTSVLTFVAPSRGLFGYRSEFLSDTRGEGILHRTVRGYEPWSGDLPTRQNGAIVATEAGDTTAYALWKIQERADLFVGPGVACYEGMIVGESRRPGDMNVHVGRAKKLTNIRAAGKDENMVLTPPRQLTIETALGWIAEDELIEITPKSIRLRKKVLSGSFRKR
ncbi:MAG TPA: translational GTPase TypA, partial [Myxococcota bacterium]|nr:translational GTPase TypA [Myxococcota bacterium]